MWPCLSSLSVLTLRKDAIEIFQKIGDTFRWEENIAKFAIAPTGWGFQSLQDFIDMVTEPKEWDALVDKVPDLRNEALAKSRVRQAWAGIVEAKSSSDKLKRKKTDDVDFDESLGREDLDDLRDKALALYHIHWQAHRMPGDLLISRVA